MLFRDLVRLFATYNDLTIALLQQFFQISDKRVARSALALYSSFTERMDRVARFLQSAQAVGVDARDLPADLARAPASLLHALDCHVCLLEGRDPPPAPEATPPARPPPPPATANPFLAAAEPPPPQPQPPPPPQQPPSAGTNPFA